MLRMRWDDWAQSWAWPGLWMWRLEVTEEEEGNTELAADREDWEENPFTFWQQQHDLDDSQILLACQNTQQSAD